MKKTLLSIAALSFLLFAGCQKNSVAPTQDSAKKSTLSPALNKGRDTIIMINSKIGPTPAKASRDTIIMGH